MLKMREQLKPLNNQGFNYSDRKSAKGTKIWVKDGREFIDYQFEHDRIEIGKIIREGEICKNVEMISKGIEMIEEKDNPQFEDVMNSELGNAQTYINSTKKRRKEWLIFRLLQKNIYLPKVDMYLEYL